MHKTQVQVNEWVWCVQGVLLYELIESVQMDDMEPTVSVWLDGDKVNSSKCFHENLPDVKTRHLTTLHVWNLCMFFVGIQCTVHKTEPTQFIRQLQTQKGPKMKGLSLPNII